MSEKIDRLKLLAKLKNIWFDCMDCKKLDKCKLAIECEKGCPDDINCNVCPIPKKVGIKLIFNYDFIAHQEQGICEHYEEEDD